MARGILIILVEVLILDLLMLGNDAHQAVNPLNGHTVPAHDHGMPEVQQHNDQQPRHNVRQHPSHGVHTMDRNIVQNQEHIMEHLDGQIRKPEDTMSEEELQFHYFKVHDYDNNNMLDGIEIISALTHHHDEAKSKEASPGTHAEPPMSDAELKKTIDAILDENDLNKDGFIDYAEFVKNQREVENAEPDK